MPKWTLEQALVVIRKLQPEAMKVGFYLALAGGVLNNGESEKDVDLVAVNNDILSLAYDLINVFMKEFGRNYSYKLINGRLHVKWPDYGFECLVVENELRGK